MPTLREQRENKIQEVNDKYDALEEMHDSLSIGQEIYEVVARYGDFDYHPQKIEQIHDDYIDVFEEGINKRTSVHIRALRKEENGWICH